ncbi:DUF2786 domain-containing protein [Acetobacter sp. DsW_063]|uniref:DUF2786 domain-containing protein n=1 Tax=Acetobacter sp. DsW_063 TaxID=1514894 RepID=UPI000B7184EC|nr:DUF2786 domain-containing protein [Acetobacter sp. DsW_063]OUJ17080.1 hypothetical protein HK28_07885 [Acetobacter sp. DsW_063]
MDKSVLERIKKLFALSKSSNPHEAASALSMAQKLMEEAGVTQDDLDLSSIEMTLSEKELKSPHNPPRWMVSLLTCVSHNFGVRVVTSDHKVFFYGNAARTSVADYSYIFLARSLQKARSEFLRTQNKRIKRTTRIGRADKFCEGWIFGCMKNLKPMAVGGHESALVDRFEREKIGPTTSYEGRSARDVNGSHAAQTKGVREGSKVVLNTGVSGGEGHAAIGETRMIGVSS